jgi:hypothetical protein
MIFVGSGSVTLLECDINELHIGLKGTMDALYLKTLPTRRAAACAAESRTASRAAPTPQPATQV